MQRMAALEMAHYKHLDFSHMPQGLPMLSTGPPVSNYRYPSPAYHPTVFTPTNSSSPKPFHNTTPLSISSASFSDVSASNPISKKEKKPPIEKDEIPASNTISKKEKSPLPPIPKDEMLDPNDVVEKYKGFLKPSRLGRLSVRLAQEAFFGKIIMAKCTVQGAGVNHALPKKELDDLKKFMQEITLPRFVDSRALFEVLWKDCTIALGQACKHLRGET